MQLGLVAFTAALGACTAGAKWEALLATHAYRGLVKFGFVGFFGSLCCSESGKLQGCLGDSVLLLLSDTNVPSCSRIGLKRNGEG